MTHVSLLLSPLIDPTGVQVVTDWVVRYFSPSGPQRFKNTVDEALRGASPVIVTDKMPLILQHNGHSRTIVGYEVSQKGFVNLLTFDPATWVQSHFFAVFSC